MDQSAVAPAAPEQPARRSIRRTLASLLFGHDYFLSYSRRDGAAYAAMLSDALEQRGLLVCFDRTDFDPGSSLSRSLKGRVQRSHRLLLVDTAEARRSKYVAEEIGHAIRRKRPIVRITDTTSHDVRWKYVDPEGMGLDDIISVNEPPLGIAGGAPCADVLHDVLRTGRKTRSLRRLTIAAVALTALFAGVVYSAWRLREMAASRELAAEATPLVEAAPRNALALAVQAAERWPTEQARRALSQALAGHRLIRVLPDAERGEYAAFSADSSMVGTVDQNGRHSVWDARTGRELLGLGDLKHAAGGDDASSLLWTPAQGASLLELCGKSRLSLPRLAPDCSRFVTNTNQGRRPEAVRVWEVASGQRLSELADHVAIGHISTGGLVVVAGGGGARLGIWNVTTAMLVRDLEPCSHGAVNAARWSNDESRVVVARDSGACAWDLRTGSRPVALSGHTRSVTDAAFSPDGKLIVTASEDQTVRIWDAETGAETAVFGSHKAPVTHAEFSADGRSLLTTSGEDPSYPPDGPDDGTLQNFDPIARVWDTGSLALLYELRMAEGEDIVRYAAFSPDGSMVVTAGDGPTRIWAANGRRLSRLPAAAAGAGRADTTTSPDGTLAIDGATVRRITSREPIFTLEDEPLASAFSLDGSRVIAVLPKKILVMDARTGSTLETLEFQGVDEIDRAMISPDRTAVAATHTYYTKTTLWDTRDGRPIEVNGNVEEWSPDGRSIVTTFERARSAIVWDANSGAPLQTFPGGTNGVSDAGFSPDGSLVVTTNGDGVTRIWDARTGREYDILPRHSGHVAATFSADGEFVHVVDGSGTTSVYPIGFTQLLALAKARLPEVERRN
jgi:WD40 repeat protein